MREDPPAFDLWLRRDLSRQYGDALREDLPGDMLDILAHHQD